MRAELLVIGDEILFGEVQDKNGPFLASLLREAGVEVRGVTLVGDELVALTEAIAAMAMRTDLMVATGGLGPTPDDRTAQAVSRVAGVDLVVDGPSLETMRERYALVGRSLTSASERQVMIPRGAVALGNDAGLAPGFCLQIEGCRAYFIPGIPREARVVARTRLLPDLGSLGVRGPALVTRVLDSFGLPEAEVAEGLGDLQGSVEGVEIAYLPIFPINRLKVVARGKSPQEAGERAQRAVEAIRGRLGHIIYSEGGASLAEGVLREMRQRGLRLAVAESCTGGLVASLITAVAGSSEVFAGGVVSYSNEMKMSLLGVPGEVLGDKGAVSAEAAAAMAEGVRRLAGADVGISTTGIAGPGGATDTKPLGLVWFGLATAEGVSTVSRRLPGDRQWVQTLAAYHALNDLRLALLKG